MSQGRLGSCGIDPDSVPRLCLHYYSNFVTLRIAEDEEDEYSIDQIKEFESVDHSEWDRITSVFGEAGSVNPPQTDNAALIGRAKFSD